MIFPSSVSVSFPAFAITVGEAKEASTKPVLWRGRMDTTDKPQLVEHISKSLTLTV